MSKEQTVLVVGGAGYIGSHTTLALNHAGFRTVVFDNFSTGHQGACFGDHLVEGDLSNRPLMAETLKRYQIDCVVHFAALIEAGQSILSPLSFFENNVSGTLALLDAMHRTEVGNLVFSSTAAVYGNNTDAPLLHEKLPRAPINPYGDSKAMVEIILEACATAHGLNSIALRYFNACGADPLGRTGERHEPETHLIPLVIQAALGQRENIRVFGTDYDTPDGTCIRDYIHVCDLATGHVAAVQRLLRGEQSGFDAVNLGTGQGLSVRQVIDAVKEISEKDIAVIDTDRRPGDPTTLVADAQKAGVDLEWKATRSEINQIVSDAWSFHVAEI